MALGQMLALLTTGLVNIIRVLQTAASDDSSLCFTEKKNQLYGS